LFTNYDNTGKFNQLATLNLLADKINQTAPDGSVVLLERAQRGNWFSNGVRSTTAVSEALDKNNVLVSPNPFRETLNVEIQSEKAATGKAEIFDLVGRSILSYPLSILGGKTPVSINTQALQTGAYLLRVTVDGKSLTKKIIKL
jgi:hypothetical protein